MALLEVALIWRWSCEKCSVLGWGGSKATVDKEISRHFDAEHDVTESLSAVCWAEQVYTVAS